MDEITTRCPASAARKCSHRRLALRERARRSWSSPSRGSRRSGRCRSARPCRARRSRSRGRARRARRRSSAKTLEHRVVVVDVELPHRDRMVGYLRRELGRAARPADRVRRAHSARSRPSAANWRAISAPSPELAPVIRIRRRRVSSREAASRRSPARCWTWALRDPCAVAATAAGRSTPVWSASRNTPYPSSPRRIGQSGPGRNGLRPRLVSVDTVDGQRAEQRLQLEQQRGHGRVQLARRPRSARRACSIRRHGREPISSYAPPAGRCGEVHDARTAARLRVGVIGAGRVGSALGAALRPRRPRRRRRERGVRASRAPAPSACCPARRSCRRTRSIAAADFVLLAVPDDTLRPLVAGLADTGAWREGQLLAHTAGAKGLAVLDPAAARGVARDGAASGDDLRRPARGRRPARRRRRSVSPRPTSCAWSPSRSSSRWAASRCGCPSRRVRSITPRCRSARITWSRWSTTRSRCSTAPASTARPAAARPAAVGVAGQRAAAARRGADRAGRARRRRDAAAAPRGRCPTRAPELLDSYLAMARRTAERAHATGQLDDARLAAVLDALA